MRETEFKVLMYNDQYVDANMLGSGIYTREMPFFYGKEETIDSMVDRYEKLKKEVWENINGLVEFPDQYIINLKQCKLVRIKIVEAPGGDVSCNNCNDSGCLYDDEGMVTGICPCHL